MPRNGAVRLIAAGGETANIGGFPFPTFKRVTSLDVQGADDRQFNNPATNIDKKFAGTAPSRAFCGLQIRDTAD